MRSDRERDLDRELRDLGPRVEYPPAPDLARSVRSRLEAEADSPGSPTRSRPQLWWIAAAALLLLVAVPVFSLAVFDPGGFLAGGGAAGGGAVEVDRGGGGDIAKRETPSSMAAEAGASSSVASGSSAAACASPDPVLEAWPARGAPGDTFEVRGRHFVARFSACDDTGPDLSAQTVPADEVRVEFRQGEKTWEFGKVEADKSSRLVARLEVPKDARPGRATLRAAYGRRPAEAPYGSVSVETRFFVLE